MSTPATEPRLCNEVQSSITRPQRNVLFDCIETGNTSLATATVHNCAGDGVGVQFRDRPDVHGPADYSRRNHVSAVRLLPSVPQGVLAALDPRLDGARDRPAGGGCSE